MNKHNERMSICFREQFPKNHRPEISDLETFWDEGICGLFKEFAEYVSREYDLRFGVPVWSKSDGWTYRIGKSGVFLITGIRIEEDGFIVDGLKIDDRDKYFVLLQHVDKIYQQNETYFLGKIAEINAKQALRNRERVERERKAFEKIQESIIPEKYNIFHWPQKLDIHKLNKLYRMDAKGIQWLSVFL